MVGQHGPFAQLPYDLNLRLTFFGLAVLAISVVGTKLTSIREISKWPGIAMIIAMLLITLPPVLLIALMASSGDQCGEGACIGQGVIAIMLLVIYMGSLAISAPTLLISLGALMVKEEEFRKGQQL